MFETEWESNVLRAGEKTKYRIIRVNSRRGEGGKVGRTAPRRKMGGGVGRTGGKRRGAGRMMMGVAIKTLVFWRVGASGGKKKENQVAKGGP